MSGSGIVEHPIDQDWFDALPTRISHRTFDRQPIDPDLLDRVETACQRLGVSSHGARAVLLRSAPDEIFTGLVGSYGGVIGAPTCVAFVGPSEDALVDVGYVGEATIMDATLAGLGTCWVAGNFDAERTASLLELSPEESVRAVTPLGYAAPKERGIEHIIHVAVRSRSRLSIEEIAPGVDAWPAWARTAAEAVRIAPSGANAQPWRLRMDGESLIVSRKERRPYWTWPIDCGIAMLHAELGALHEGVEGHWARLTEPEVAAFTPSVGRSG